MMAIRFLILFSFVALSPPINAAISSTWVSELKTAQQLFSQNKYTEAKSQYLKYAQKNGLAQLALGLINANGLGQNKSEKQACIWFKKAAENNIPRGEHLWAKCLADNHQSTAEILLAVAWYEKAASHGHLISNCYAADYYIQGIGVERNSEKAIAMCSEVANINSLPAISKMAEYYSTNKFISIDVAKAEYWFQRGAEMGAAELINKWALFVSAVDGADSSRAVYLAETAAAQGYAPAYLSTAVLYTHAPKQENGAISPEHLAKIYLWGRAARASCNGIKDNELISSIESLLAGTLPETWIPNLDKKIDQHFKKYPVASKEICTND